MARVPREQRESAKLKVEVGRIDTDVAEVNKTYALVMVGDRPVVMNTSDGIKMMTVQAFGQWKANKFVQHNDKRKPLAKHWMEHSQRRQYDGIVFDPSGKRVPRGHYNIWRGYSCKPKEGGDCTLFLKHVADNICSGDPDIYAWVIGWFAQIIQQPWKKLGTSLVTIGPQGTGKTLLGQIIGSLLGVHYTIVSDPRYIYGRFNAHLVSNILMHLDEAIWAGDKKAEGQLKDLITGSSQMIEYKGKEPIVVNNFVRAYICSNNPWAVPAGFGERRFAVLRVGEDQMQNKKYFGAIVREMEKPGAREALLHFLLNYDIAAVDLRTIPKTDALREQKDATLDAEQSWWLDTLSRGQLPWGCRENRSCPTFRLFNRYIKSASRQGHKRRSSETRVGKFLKDNVPGLRRNIDGKYEVWTKSGTLREVTDVVYEFPSLAECRKAFSDKMQHDREWDERVDWSHETAPDFEDDDDEVSKHI
jgi:hypothetical protein